MDCTITNEFIVAPPEVSTLSVVKQVICPQDFGCPESSDFTIHVSGNNPDPSTFAGSALGTTVQVIFIRDSLFNGCIFYFIR